MGTVVDVVVPTDQFALRDTFETVPEAKAETERVVAHDAGEAMPFLWATAPCVEALDEALREDATTEAVTRLTHDDGHVLYQITWESRIRDIVEEFVESSGTLLGACGHNGEWELRVLFSENEPISSTYESWKDLGIDPTVRRVNDVEKTLEHGGMDLSDEQQEALVSAWETDYYNVPREVTLGDLSESLNLSHQALSERLRRGHRNLIRTTLCETPYRNGESHARR
jgi:predicted DNA binding protein